MTNSENVRMRWSAYYLFAYSRAVFSGILRELTYVWFGLKIEFYEAFGVVYRHNTI